MNGCLLSRAWIVALAIVLAATATDRGAEAAEKADAAEKIEVAEKAEAAEKVEAA